MKPTKECSFFNEDDYITDDIFCRSEDIEEEEDIKEYEQDIEDLSECDYYDGDESDKFLQ